VATILNILRSMFYQRSTISIANTTKCADDNMMMMMVLSFLERFLSVLFSPPGSDSLRTVAYLGFGKGAWRARRARAYNGGLGAEPPAGSRGRDPGREVRGQSPPEAQGGPEAETLFAFVRSMVAANSRIFSEICWKTAKNTPFHIKSPVKNFHGRAKGGYRTMPPKYATACGADSCFAVVFFFFPLA